MASFKDKSGQEWFLSITFGDSQRVKKKLGISLLHLCDDECKGLVALLNDMEKLVDVVGELIGKEHADRMVEGLDGDALEAMAEAFMQALTDFFPNRQGRKILLAMTQKSKVAAEQLADQALAALDKVTPEAILTAVRKSSAPSSSSPASSA